MFVLVHLRTGSRSDWLNADRVDSMVGGWDFCPFLHAKNYKVS